MEKRERVWEWSAMEDGEVVLDDEVKESSFGTRNDAVNERKRDRDDDERVSRDNRSVVEDFEELEEEEEEDEEALLEARRKKRREIMEKYSRSECHDEKQKMHVKTSNRAASTFAMRPDMLDTAAQRIDAKETTEEEKKKEEAVDDDGIASESLDDMFADDKEDDTIQTTRGKNPRDAAAQTTGRSAGGVAGRTLGLRDAFDDAEGYYKTNVGELVDGGRYQVRGLLGRGVFSTVLAAEETDEVIVREEDAEAHTASGREGGSRRRRNVAIKMIRSNETMYKAGQLELNILRKLSESAASSSSSSSRGSRQKTHVVSLLRHFEHRGHLCLVFERLDLNLREMVKKFGRGIGLSIRAVRGYAYQLLLALRHLRDNGVLHADIKPDNILVDESRATVTLCDFGSAMFAGENDITPYLVSRFYRSPEVILGLAYGHALDMWALGCTIFELFTGRIAFAGRSNNEMLKLMTDVKGELPRRMVRKGLFSDKHLEQEAGEMRFRLLEPDPVTGRDAVRIVAPKRCKDVKQMIMEAHTPPPQAAILADPAVAAAAGQDRKRVQQLGVLIDIMFALDPDKRVSVQHALANPLFKELPTRLKASAIPPPGAALPPPPASV